MMSATSNVIRNPRAVRAVRRWQRGMIRDDTIAEQTAVAAANEAAGIQPPQLPDDARHRGDLVWRETTKISRVVTTRYHCCLQNKNGQLCTLSCSSYNNLVRHMTDNHIKRAIKFFCGICSTTLTRFDNFIKHCQTPNHRSRDTDDNLGACRCSTCDVECGTPVSLLAHFDRLHNGKKKINVSKHLAAVDHRNEFLYAMVRRPVNLTVPATTAQALVDETTEDVNNHTAAIESIVNTEPPTVSEIANIAESSLINNSSDMELVQGILNTDHHHNNNIGLAVGVVIEPETATDLQGNVTESLAVTATNNSNNINNVALETPLLTFPVKKFPETPSTEKDKDGNDVFVLRTLPDKTMVPLMVRDMKINEGNCDLLYETLPTGAKLHDNTTIPMFDGVYALVIGGSDWFHCDICAKFMAPSYPKIAFSCCRKVYGIGCWMQFARTKDGCFICRGECLLDMMRNEYEAASTAQESATSLRQLEHSTSYQHILGNTETAIRLLTYLNNLKYSDAVLKDVLRAYKTEQTFFDVTATVHEVLYTENHGMVRSLSVPASPTPTITLDDDDDAIAEIAVAAAVQAEEEASDDNNDEDDDDSSSSDDQYEPPQRRARLDENA